MSTHRCNKCSESFDSVWPLEHHINEIHLKYYPFKCLMCDIDFCTEKLIFDHLNELHPGYEETGEKVVLYQEDTVKLDQLNQWLKDGEIVANNSDSPSESEQQRQNKDSVAKGQPTTQVPEPTLQCKLCLESLECGTSMLHIWHHLCVYQFACSKCHYTTDRKSVMIKHVKEGCVDANLIDRESQHEESIKFLYKMCFPENVIPNEVPEPPNNQTNVVSKLNKRQRKNAKVSKSPEPANNRTNVVRELKKRQRKNANISKVTESVSNQSIEVKELKKRSHTETDGSKVPEMDNHSSDVRELKKGQHEEQSKVNGKKAAELVNTQSIEVGQLKKLQHKDQPKIIRTKPAGSVNTQSAEVGELKKRSHKDAHKNKAPESANNQSKAVRQLRTRSLEVVDRNTTPKSAINQSRVVRESRWRPCKATDRNKVTESVVTRELRPRQNKDVNQRETSQITNKTKDANKGRNSKNTQKGENRRNTKKRPPARKLSGSKKNRIVCEICMKAVPHDSITAHSWSHMDVRPFSCSNCGRATHWPQQTELKKKHIPNKCPGAHVVDYRPENRAKYYEVRGRCFPTVPQRWRRYGQQIQQQQFLQGKIMTRSCSEMINVHFGINGEALTKPTETIVPSQNVRNVGASYHRKRRECNVCGKEVICQMSYMLCHTWSHLGFKLFGCSICQRQYVQNVSALRHIRSSTKCQHASLVDLRNKNKKKIDKTLNKCFPQ